MGVAISKYSELSTNELLLRFCSAEVISPNDPFWNQLLAYNITPPASAEEQLVFDSNTEPLLQTFLQNNLQSGNLGSLLHVFITRATQLLATPTSDNVMLAWQTYNALFVIRAVSKYLVEVVPEPEVCRHLDAQPERGGEDEPDESPQDSPGQESSPNPPQMSPRLLTNDNRVEMLIDALLGLVIDVPVHDNTYYLHLECINTLLVLMSVYMFAGVHGQPRVVETSLIFRALYEGRYGLQAPLLVRALLAAFASMRAAPPSMFGTRAGGGSLFVNLATGFWSMLSLSSPADSPNADSEDLSSCPLAKQSCLLLLALSNHCIQNGRYREALLLVEEENATTTPQKESNGTLTPPRIDMAALHKALCATATSEYSTLLLYLMLHSCKAYKRYISNCPQIENLVLPILQVIYNAQDNSCHHVYMSLIVLLILTEDDNFIRNIHQIPVPRLPWCSWPSSVPTGGVVVVVLVRALQYNMAAMRDKYLHTNCLAALANMSSEFRHLHPFVCQRLVQLVALLSRRRARLLPRASENDTLEHINVLDEVLRMMLEIINSCLSHQLQNNLNLVYALLHQRELFNNQTHPVAANIQMVIGYFSSRLQRVQEHAGGELSVGEVLAALRKGAEQWSSDRLKKFPDLKFRYVEEERPEEFFTPYVWTLISSCGNIYWSSECAARGVDLMV